VQQGPLATVPYRSIDLLDYAATMTLRQAGQVTLVEPSSLPRQPDAAALLRY
jgi:hypothetical protein